jgi:hypothetical protein
MHPLGIRAKGALAGIAAALRDTSGIVLELVLTETRLPHTSIRTETRRNDSIQTSAQRG